MLDTSLNADLTWLAGLARALIREPHAADDLVQDTAMAALVQPAPTGDRRRPWLRSVAQRLAKRRFRGEGRRARREALAARSQTLPDPVELAERAEVAEQVAAAVRQLPEPFRQTLLLHFLEGRSTTEVAQLTGKPVDTIRARLRRGLAILREDLTRQHDRDWAAWCVVLTPLAQSYGSASVGVVGTNSWILALWTTMKTTKVLVAAALVVGLSGLWLTWSGVATPSRSPAIAQTNPVATEPELEVLLETPVAAAQREDLNTSPKTITAPSRYLRGIVVDADGRPVPQATVYLFPATKRKSRRPVVLARTNSSVRGAFRLEPPRDRMVDLGVHANGFLRKIVPVQAGASELRVVLDRGRTLTGRVVDEQGLPVQNLSILAYTRNAGVDHVSPTQRRLRAERSILSGSMSGYQHCIAATDGRGEVTFTGLPAGDLEVLALQPGWAIVAPRYVQAGTAYVEWRAKSRLGVRLIVVDKISGQPVAKAAATFGFKAVFQNGETDDFSQWVGRGSGEVSFVLGAGLLPGLEKRNITRTTFYGTARAKGGKSVKWTAKPIAGTGVAEVRVAVPAAAPETDTPTVDPNVTTTLELDIRYADSTPFLGQPEVWWKIGKEDDRVRPKPTAPGRYRITVPVGAVQLEVRDRFTSGTLPMWTKTVQCQRNSVARAFVTFQRGAVATIPRPEGLRGEWFVRASYRTSSTEEWRGAWGYSTAETEMVLRAMRPAEWRFEMRQRPLDADPIVRTVVLADRQKATVR